MSHFAHQSFSVRGCRFDFLQVTLCFLVKGQDQDKTLRLLAVSWLNAGIFKFCGVVDNLCLNCANSTACVKYCWLFDWLHSNLIGGFYPCVPRYLLAVDCLCINCAG